MRYRLELDPPVRDYLKALPLTREGRLRVYVSLNLTFASAADDLRTRAEREPPDSPLFIQSFVFRDAGRQRTLFLAVDDSTAAYGVLRVVYAELL